MIHFFAQLFINIDAPLLIVFAIFVAFVITPFILIGISLTMLMRARLQHRSEKRAVTILAVGSALALVYFLFSLKDFLLR